MSAYEDARAKVAPLKKGPRCTMGSLLRTLTPDDRTALQDDLDNPFVQGTRIGKALAEMGSPIGQHVLDRHRRGDCGCT